MEEILHAAGRAARSSPSSATPTSSAAPAWAPPPRDGVVDADHRVFGVPNLYLVDGSVLPTQGSANPALTIMALAARCADRLIARGRRGLTETAVHSAMTADRPTVIDDVADRVYRFPTAEPEADGTLSWDATTVVIVAVHGGRPRPGSAGPTAPGRRRRHPRPPGGRGPRQRRMRHPAPAGRRCTAPCRNLGTRGLVMQRHSAPSTSPGGTSKPACSASR